MAVLGMLVWVGMLFDANGPTLIVEAFGFCYFMFGFVFGCFHFVADVQRYRVKTRLELILAHKGMHVELDLMMFQLNVLTKWLSTASPDSVRAFNKFQAMWCRYQEKAAESREILHCSAVCQSLALRAPELLTWGCAARIPFKATVEQASKGLFAVRYHIEKTLETYKFDFEKGKVVNEDVSHSTFQMLGFILRDHLENQRIRGEEMLQSELRQERLFSSNKVVIGDPQCSRLAGSAWFSNLILLVIAANLIVTIAQLGFEGDGLAANVFLGFELLFTAVFLSEAAIKIRGYTFWVYWADFMNRVVILASALLSQSESAPCCRTFVSASPR